MSFSAMSAYALTMVHVAVMRIPYWGDNGANVSTVYQSSEPSISQGNVGGSETYMYMYHTRCTVDIVPIDVDLVLDSRTCLRALRRAEIFTDA